MLLDSSIALNRAPNLDGIFGFEMNSKVINKCSIKFPNQVQIRISEISFHGLLQNIFPRFVVPMD